jgi:hypothetical protein
VHIRGPLFHRSHQEPLCSKLHDRGSKSTSPVSFAVIGRLDIGWLLNQEYMRLLQTNMEQSQLFFPMDSYSA